MLSLRSHSAGRRAQVAKMCWSCALKQQRWLSLFGPSTTKALSIASSPRIRPSSTRLTQTTTSSKALYNSHSRLQEQLNSTPTSDPPIYNPAIASLDQLGESDKPSGGGGIRQQLRKWNEEHAGEQAEAIQEDDVNHQGELSNTFTRLGDMENFRRPEESLENDRDDIAHLAQTEISDLGDWDPAHRFLRRGDLVLLDFPRSEREPILAIFARRVGNPLQSQFYTIHGKWIHATERHLQHAVLDFVPASAVDPILPYLPETGITEELLDRSQMFDLSVPRHVSAPLVTRMLEFQRKSEEIYRQNASTLDNAHHTLAHPTDLKFGTLESIATKLLDKDEDGSMSQEKIYAVRRAIARAGFAFGHDRRSHRVTGFVQIRSKEQVANVQKIRYWLRAWQDDLATFAASKSADYKFSTTGQYVVNFIHKAQSLIDKSRKLRDITPSGRLGPSKKRFHISKEDTVQYKYTVEFDDNDRELIKFIEAWACSGLFLGLPRVEALPPLLLQATGKYESYNLDVKTGFTFLQEIGVLTPHENRVRFDPHLLLPSSQHSKPLQHLMTKVMSMRVDPNLVDSMAHLRKDWADLPVFCIDGEGAHEIDDGVSVEDAGDGAHWMHVHIANPTAFLDQTSPLAKMARHMTETIYMPERPFSMLPRWLTAHHFSLARGRPCLTFSAKINKEGETVEHKVQPGVIHNVKFISPAAAARVVGVDAHLRPDVVLRVGGNLPHQHPKKTGTTLTQHEIEMLKTMQMIAEKRQAKRRNAGGLFLDSAQPDFSIWSHYRHPGLGWEHPSRAKARYTEGDPIIEYRTKELVSWFSSGEGVSDILVRELMLLACEIGAGWCAERNIPIIYRGTVDSPDAVDPKAFYNNILAPAIEKNNGEAPMHLAIEYLRNTGSTILTTKPLHHRVLGLPNYSKATSPLRRYGDMILHWQVEAALRAEAEAGKQLDFSGTNQSKLPFSDEDLKVMSTGLRPRESMIRRATTYAEGHWLATLFFRAYYYNECELPSTFTAYMYMQPNAQKREIAVLIKEYSFAATMRLPEDYGLCAAKSGDSWECVIESVDVFARTLWLKPLRLINRWEG